MLNLSRVNYADSVFAEGARRLRRDHAHGGRNICTIGLTNGVVITRASIPPGAQGVTPLHSEQAALQALDETGSLGRDVRIAWVYTERYPCGHNQGMRNCYGTLENALRHWGDTGLDTPVYFSFEYPDVSYMLFTLLFAQFAYRVLQERSAADQAVIRLHASILVQLGEYLHANNIEVNSEMGATIAWELYSFFRDDAITELMRMDQGTADLSGVAAKVRHH